MDKLRLGVVASAEEDGLKARQSTPVHLFDNIIVKVLLNVIVILKNGSNLTFAKSVDWKVKTLGSSCPKNKILNFLN